MGLGQSYRGALFACPHFRVQTTAAAARTIIDTLGRVGEVLSASTLFNLSL